MSLEIRLLSDTDSLEELTALLHRAYAELAAMGLRYTATYQDVATTRRRVSGAECFVATIESRIVATITLRPPGTIVSSAEWYQRAGVAVVGQLAVEPAYQRRGIGTTLLAHAEHRARELGATEVALDTADQSHHLIDYYQKRGYRIVGEAQWSQKNYRSVIMSRAVGAPAGREH